VACRYGCGCGAQRSARTRRYTTDTTDA
jgi:hypothetical protein